MAQPIFQGRTTLGPPRHLLVARASPTRDPPLSNGDRPSWPTGFKASDKLWDRLNREADRSMSCGDPNLEKVAARVPRKIER
jgi:hypothetical protein